MLAYCDFIADTIKKAFTNDKPENLIAQVGSVKMDLHPIDGYFLSTKKTVVLWRTSMARCTRSLLE